MPSALGVHDTPEKAATTAIRDHESARHAVPDQTFSWVHVGDLLALIADLAAGRVACSSDLRTGLVEGGCTVVNVAAGPATLGNYYETVTGGWVWSRSGMTPAWAGRILAERAHE